MEHRPRIYYTEAQAWRNGIYPFHRFHCYAHETLGVYSGEVTAQFGGDDGIVITARPGA